MKHSNISIFIPHLGCPYNCIFCNQYKITGSDSAVTPLDVYNTLKESIKQVKNPANTQIAFFGGSFTAIPRDLMIEYLRVANEFIGPELFDSIRISTRPDCIDNEILSILKEYHVKTIELGIQSLDDEVLMASKRGHNSSVALNSCKLIMSHGFELGMQMMCGLPCDTFEKDIFTANKIIELGCKQVRIYPVVVMEDTYLHKMYQSGEYSPLGVDEAVNICASLYRLFKENDVTVLKVGLHTENGIVAGPFHPAFGELVRSQIFYNNVTRKIDGHKDVEIKVSPNYLSIAKGNGKRNLKLFQNNGINATIVADPNVENGDFKVIKKSPV